MSSRKLESSEEMRIVYKYRIEVGIRQKIVAKPPFIPIFVHEQDGEVTLWAEVGDSLSGEPEITVEVMVIGTGHLVPPGFVYVGSAMCGAFVWHVYVRL